MTDRSIAPIRVTVVSTRGSAPRDRGTQMLVWSDRTHGTIGGGALEWEAMAIARDMLETDGPDRVAKLPLGPNLGQCCGGVVSLRFDRGEIAAGTGTPIWIWGAGHVGRALAGTLDPLPDLSLTWIDTAPDRFPEGGPVPDARLVAQQPDRVVRHAPPEAHHLIVTYSHEIDLALCHGLLSHRFGSCGLIGSATKWARFRSRLRDLGHSDAAISRITCPIGDPSLGKHPQAIAVGVAARLLCELGTTQRLDDTGT